MGASPSKAASGLWGSRRWACGSPGFVPVPGSMRAGRPRCYAVMARPRTCRVSCRAVRRRRSTPMLWTLGWPRRGPAGAARCRHGQRAYKVSHRGRHAG